MNAQEICYLCGEQLSGQTSRDHVPMRQLFSREIRARHNPDLITLKTHYDCNRAFQSDEEYFVHTFAPMAMRSYAGGSVVRELVEDFHKGRNVPLMNQVLGEFDRQPSGLHLPGRLVAKQTDGERVARVLWKIIRGLFFYEYGRFMPPETLRETRVVSPHAPPPPGIVTLLQSMETRGKHPAVFDYRYRQFPDALNGHFWAMLFLDTFLAWAVFHDPDCDCDECAGT